MALEEINLLDRDEYVKGVPHHWFRQLRRECPVYHHPEPNGGPGFWVVSKHADLRAATLDTDTFSSRAELGGVVNLEHGFDLPAAMDGQQTFLNVLDGEEHRAFRKLVSVPFTPRVMRALEDHVRDICGGLLNDAIAKGTCDWVMDVAAELPITVICEFLGVPHEMRRQVLNWSNQIVGSDDPEFMLDPDVQNRSLAEMFAYGQALAEERRKEPRDDIITMLLQAEVDGEQLTDMEFNQFFMVLAVAGNETTRYTLANSITAFADNPEQYQALRNDPSLIPVAVEEMLRWATPISYFRRTATRDVELNGSQIKAGDKVALFYLSANYDEDIFAEPERFDVRRAPNPHVSFGGGGAHICLGAALARMQLRIMMEELVKRVPEIKLAGDPVRLRSIFVNGNKHVPIDLTGATVIATAETEAV